MANGKRTLEIIIAGNASGAERAMQAVSGAAGGMGRVVKGAGLAAAAGITASAGAAAFAVNEAMGFQDQMREVFTLLPGISADAMSQMSESVKGFSNEFGVLPNEVVPALYQSLSAGVPQDNVFDFLETAQKAAKGGVTDLTTAVDGISTVVNAYGSDVISAGEASDLMFTAVRLGKTNFEELSASMSNVIPAAATLGVGMDEVAAGIAVLTAQGTPTAQATTQIRAAIVDLGSQGKKSFEAFREAAGTTFPEFMAQGGSLGEAMQILQGHADATGVTMLDLFGRVEGGMGALAISSDGFQDAFAEMQASAGATDAAFETMNQGLSASMDRMRARFITTAITVGEKLMPHVERFADWIEDTAIPNIEMLVRLFQDEGLSGVLSHLGARLEEAWPSIRATLGRMAEGFVAWLGDITPPLLEKAGELLVALGTWIVEEGAPALMEQLQEWGAAFVDWIGPRIKPALEELGRLLADVGEWLLDEGLPTLVEKLAEWGAAFIDWVIPMIPPLLRELGNMLLAVGDWLLTEAPPHRLLLWEWTVAFVDWALTDLAPALLEALGEVLLDLGAWMVTDAAPAIGSLLTTWANAFVDWAKGIPGKIFDGLATLGEKIWEALKAAWDYAKGKLADLNPLSLPGVDIPGVGGFSLGDLNPFHSGGTFIPSGQGNTGLAILRRGERVSTPANAQTANAAGAAGQEVNIYLDSQVLVSTLERHALRNGPLNLRVTGIQ